MGDQVVVGLLGILLGGGLISGVAALLTARSGREAKFNERIDKELDRLRTREDELEAEVRREQQANAELRQRNRRLVAALRAAVTRGAAGVPDDLLEDERTS